MKTFTVIIQDCLDTVVYDNIIADSPKRAFEKACLEYADWDAIEPWNDYACVAVFEGNHSNLYRDAM
ncbi:hypothetical protein [Klebsiella phage phiKp_21]|nr:hypothetical protein [Klebsiella phage phiKp_21]